MLIFSSRDATPSEAARRADIIFGLVTALALSAGTIYFLI